jgi:hypothetical protein
MAVIGPPSRGRTAQSPIFLLFNHIFSSSSHEVSCITLKMDAADCLDMFAHFYHIM